MPWGAAAALGLGALGLVGNKGPSGSLGNVIRNMFGLGVGPIGKGAITKTRTDNLLSNMLGGATPESLLMQGGQVPPQQMLSSQIEARRGAEAGARQTEADLARRGLTGSAAGQAITSAQRQSGEDLSAQLRFAFEQAAQDRLRSDLLNFFINPELARQGIQVQQSLQNQVLQQQQQNNMLQMLGFLATGIGGLGGGGGGATFSPQQQSALSGFTGQLPFFFGV